MTPFSTKKENSNVYEMVSLLSLFGTRIYSYRCVEDQFESHKSNNVLCM
ncbi:1572_t:CDS:2 [Funneliformis mosseae]|uniref:1572_t:CDS:1 n=1 Tax=Funneliformis mosseae TaxID=27381 RepID=A0A9N8WU33_FUNMO|nr:1572_t:CDS:2 [Funneliformis mosseae]